jgi:hypothetical protein
MSPCVMVGGYQHFGDASCLCYLRTRDHGFGDIIFLGILVPTDQNASCRNPEDRILPLSLSLYIYIYVTLIFIPLSFNITNSGCGESFAWCKTNEFSDKILCN